MPPHAGPNGPIGTVLLMELFCQKPNEQKREVLAARGVWPDGKNSQRFQPPIGEQAAQLALRLPPGGEMLGQNRGAKVLAGEMVEGIHAVHFQPGLAQNFRLFPAGAAKASIV